VSNAAASAAEAVVLVAREAAKGPSARTLLPTPAFLRNDRRLNPVFIVCSKANLPVLLLHTWRTDGIRCRFRHIPKWPMNYHYSFVHTVAEGCDMLFALQKAWRMRLG